MDQKSYTPTFKELAAVITSNGFVKLTHDGLTNCSDDRYYHKSDIDGLFQITSLSQDRVYLINENGYELDDLEYSDIEISSTESCAAICLEERDRFAIEFAEWIDDRAWMIDAGIWNCDEGLSYLTTAELLQLFNNR